MSKSVGVSWCVLFFNLTLTEANERIKKRERRGKNVEGKEKIKGEDKKRKREIKKKKGKEMKYTV